MPTITSVSDLRNYGNVLEKVRIGSPVYLTRNGRGAYSIRDIKDEENFQKAEAMIQLMCELNAGLRSAEGFIRRSLAKSVNLRNTPEIKFVLDQSIEYGIHMSKMIDEVTKDIKEKPDEEA